jgi:hypothetical protein
MPIGSTMEAELADKVIRNMELTREASTSLWHSKVVQISGLHNYELLQLQGDKPAGDLNASAENDDRLTVAISYATVLSLPLIHPAT